MSALFVSVHPNPEIGCQRALKRQCSVCGTNLTRFLPLQKKERAEAKK
jgi:hypothetical protein